MTEPSLVSPTRLPVFASAIPSSTSTTQAPRKDGSKRRSLLLPPGSLVAASQRNSTASPKQSRPMTMFGGDMRSLAALSAQFAEEDEGEGGASEEDARAAAHARLTGESSTPSKPKIGIPRSQSVRRPGNGVDGSSGARGMRPLHARNGSVAANTSAYSSRPLSTLVESKRPSRPGSVASSASTKSTTDGMQPPRTKLPSSANNTTSLRRTASTASRHTRTQSALPASANLSGIALPRPTSELRRHPTTSEGGDGRNKPAFSTLQQHYSPRKNSAPKPASSTLIHAQNTVDTTSSISLDTQFLQARLLQLSIIHRESDIALKSWEDDARRKLRKRFDAVAANCEIVQEKEKECRKRANVHALQQWGVGDSGLLAENVQLLAGVVTEVSQLVEPDGRLQGILDIFEEWIKYVSTIWDTRYATHSPADVEFIEGLGEPWRAEVRALSRRLAGMGRVLEGLESPKEGSSLRALVDGSTHLINGSLEELKVVLKLEGEAVKREKLWVDERMGRLERELLY